MQHKTVRRYLTPHSTVCVHSFVTTRDLPRDISLVAWSHSNFGSANPKCLAPTQVKVNAAPNHVRRYPSTHRILGELNFVMTRDLPPDISLVAWSHWNFGGAAPICLAMMHVSVNKMPNSVRRCPRLHSILRELNFATPLNLPQDTSLVAWSHWKFGGAPPICLALIHVSVNKMPNLVRSYFSNHKRV